MAGARRRRASRRSTPRAAATRSTSSSSRERRTPRPSQRRRRRPPTGRRASPAAVREAIAGELDALSAGGRELLQAAAVAGEPFDLDLAAEVAALDEPSAFAALDELVYAELLRETDVPGQLVFRHPIVRRAVYDATGSGWLLAAHRRAALRWHDRGAAIGTRAYHVERSAEVGRPGRDRAADPGRPRRDGARTRRRRHAGWRRRCGCCRRPPTPSSGWRCCSRSRPRSATSAGSRTASAILDARRWACPRGRRRHARRADREHRPHRAGTRPRKRSPPAAAGGARRGRARQRGGDRLDDRAGDQPSPCCASGTPRPAPPPAARSARRRSESLPLIAVGGGSGCADRGFQGRGRAAASRVLTDEATAALDELADDDFDSVAFEALANTAYSEVSRDRWETASRHAERACASAVRSGMARCSWTS